MAINRNFNLDELLNVLTVDNTDKNETAKELFTVIADYTKTIDINSLPQLKKEPSQEINFDQKKTVQGILKKNTKLNLTTASIVGGVGFIVTIAHFALDIQNNVEDDQRYAKTALYQKQGLDNQKKLIELEKSKIILLHQLVQDKKEKK